MVLKLVVGTDDELIDGKSFGTKDEVLLNMTVGANDGDTLVVVGKNDGIILETNDGS